MMGPGLDFVRDDGPYDGVCRCLNSPLWTMRWSGLIVMEMQDNEQEKMVQVYF